MSKGIELFSVHIRVSVSRPPVDLLCQALDIEGEKVLWVDGMTMLTPVLLPIAAIAECIEYRGTFRDFVSLHMPQAGEVIRESAGHHSPVVMARAIQVMSRDRNLSAQDALHLIVEEGLDILDADSGDAEVFFRETKSQGQGAANLA